VISIGLDLSTTNSGLVELHNGVLHKFTLISPNKEKDIYDRSAEVIENILLWDIPSNAKIVIESGALYGKGKRNELAMLNGAVFYCLKMKGFDVSMIPPSKLKKWAVGKGNAKKEDMRAGIAPLILETFLNKYKKVDDLIDAYFLALWGYSCLSQ